MADVVPESRCYVHNDEGSPRWPNDEDNRDHQSWMRSGAFSHIPNFNDVVFIRPHQCPSARFYINWTYQPQDEASPGSIGH
jgi:hypothetical protein